MKSKFKVLKFGSMILVVLVLACLIHIYNHYRIITEKYALDWGNTIQISEIGYKDVVFVENEENSIVYYILDKKGKIEKNKIEKDGSVDSLGNLAVDNYSDEVFVKNVFFLKNKLMYLKNNNLYLYDIDFAGNKTDGKVIHNNVLKIDFIEDENTGDLYYGILKDDYNIDVYKLNGEKVLEYKADKRIKGFNIAFNNELYLQTIENLDAKEDEIYIMKSSDLSSKQKVFSVSLFNGYSVYNLETEFMGDQMVIAFNNSLNQKGSVYSDIQVMILDSNLKVSKIFEVNPNEDALKAANIDSDFKLLVENRNIFLTIEAVNTMNKLSSYKDLCLIKLDENAKLEQADFITNTLSHIKLGDIVTIENDKWLLAKEIKGDGYNLIINSNSESFVSKKQISKEDTNLAIKHGLTAPIYALIFTFINILIMVIYLLIPMVVVGTIYFVKNIKNDKLKFGIMYVIFVGIYIYTFNSIYISADVLKFAPSIFATGLAYIYVPITILFLSFLINIYYKLRIDPESGYTAWLMVNAGFSILIACLIYIPFNYINIIIMH